MGRGRDARREGASAVIAGALLPVERRVDDVWVLLSCASVDDHVVGLAHLVADLLHEIGQAHPAPLDEVAERVCASVDTRVATGPFGFTAASCADAQHLVRRLASVLASAHPAWDPAAEFTDDAHVLVSRVTTSLAIGALACVYALAEATGRSVEDVVRRTLFETPVTLPEPAPAPVLVG